MTHQKKLLSTASILALALTLSACGSNSNDTSEAPTDPVETPADPYKTATDLTALSSDDPQEAGSALMKATEAAEKITLLGSNGDSNAAMMSAQAVLDARTELEDAKSSAEKVLADLPDTPENAAERDMLETAITAAEDVIDGVLKAEIVKVTGTNEDEPKTAEDKGQEVAEKVLARFANGFNAVDGLIIAQTVHPSHSSNFIPSDDHSAVTDMTSSGGQTFGEIFSSDVTERPLGAEGALVPTILITGEINYGIDPTETDTKFPLGDKIENSWFGSTDMANGIGGFFHCVGAGCEIKDDKLVGPWVFAPGDYSPKITPQNYVAMEDGEGYTKVQHVWYGHWLRAFNDDDVRIYVSARLDNQDDDPARKDNWKAIEGEDASATYSGNTVGRSVRHEFATDGKVAATHSGSFTADVDFTATFGASPMLEGKVSRFSAVDNVKAVNTGWEVTLEDGSISGDFGPTAAYFKGVSKGGREIPAQDQSRRSNEWWALGYLDEGEDPNPGSGHPDGIYGGFHADFTDGQAAGAFATRKDN